MPYPRRPRSLPLAAGAVVTGVVMVAGPIGPAGRAEAQQEHVAAVASACRTERLDAGGALLAAAPHLDVGRLVIGTLPGPTLDSATRQLLARRDLGGLLLFGRNVRTPKQLRALDAAIHRASGPGAIVTTDQEGGVVRRVPFAGPALGAAEQGARGPAVVHGLWVGAGRQLRALGIDVDLAPVADLATPGDFEGDRAFRGASSAVAGLVTAAVRGLHDGGEGATVKHFPGLAGVHTSTDVGPQRGRSVNGPDLAPFRAAIRAGVPIVMVDLARHPGLGSRPAALSAASYVLLRDRLGFRGVTITDALDARAATSVGSEPANAVAAVCAGADLVLAPGNARLVGQVVDALATAVRSGRLPRSRVAAALERTAALDRGLQIPTH